MKKFLLFVLLPILALASDLKSQFFTGFSALHSKIGFYENGKTSYFGNGDFHIYGGYELRIAKWFSMSPAIDIERNGWSWDRTGHKGEISYLNPSLRLSLDFHLTDFFAGIGGSYGFPFYYGAKKDGKSSTKEAAARLSYSVMLFYSLGYTIKQHYRVGLFQAFEGLYGTDSDHDVVVWPIGFFFAYLF